MSYFDKVRVRVAPSPTGDPHVGTAYVTVFNYVFAKKHGGDFILRVEDTDQQRFISSSEQQIYESLRWLGLEWDEGPDIGGDYGPYRQSERKEIHQEHASMLVQKGKAYKCFCTSERLDQVRTEQKANGQRTGYDGFCRSLSQEQIQAREESGAPFVVRLKTPDEGVTSFHDGVRGNIEIKNSQLDDQVLIKSDGFPTYHLANVVDDHLMKISHVIRAEEWISSTPKHVMLYEAFGWEMPVFAHVPILRNANKSKISKRKNPVSLSYYRRKGILPGALVNFLALMGWSYGDDQEIFTLDEMKDKFTIEDIHPGGPVFDQAKLNHINQIYIQKMSEGEFVSHLRNELFSESYLGKLFPLLKERLESFEQFSEKANFLFQGAMDYSGVPLLPKGKEPKELKDMLAQLLEKVDQCYEWNAKDIQTLMDGHRAELGWKPKDYYMTIRLIVTGRKDSPPLAESMEVTGREMVRYRLRDVMNHHCG